MNVLELGEAKKIKVQGVVDHVLERGLIVTTDYPLEAGQVLQFDEEISGHRLGIVKRALKYGKIYMAHIDFK